MSSSFDRYGIDLRILRFRHTGQSEDKLRPHALSGDSVDMLPVGGDNLLHNRQAQPGSTLVLAPGGVRLVKPLPDLLHAVPGNPDAFILYGNKDLFMAQGRFDGYNRVVGTELNGIIQEVVHNLLNLSHICGYILLLGVKEKLKGNTAFPALAFKGSDGIFNHPIDVKIGDIQTVSLGVERI